MTTRLGPRGGDFLVHIESAQKCLSSSQLTMPASGGPHSYDQIVAVPLAAGGVLALVAGVADIVAFAVYGPPIDGLADAAVTGAVPEYTIIDDFTGAVLNESALPATDSAGTPWVVANIKLATALVAAGVKWVANPVKTSTQTN